MNIVSITLQGRTRLKKL